MTNIKSVLALFYTTACAFILPIVPFLIMVLMLVTADFFTGIQAAKKRKEIINSKGLRRSGTKIIMYFILILLSKGMEDVFFQDVSVPLVYMSSAYVAYTEYISVLENVEEVTGLNLKSKIISHLQALIPGKQNQSNE